MAHQPAQHRSLRPLTQLLPPGVIWSLEESLRLVQRLTVQLEALHASGRIHRAIAMDTVQMDDQMRPQLSPSPSRRRFGGECSDPEFCPPELAQGDALELPEQTAVAAEVLQAQGHLFDPRRIDVYQLGTLLCRLLTGESVAAYMFTARIKRAVPTAARSLLERMLGYDANDRLSDASSLVAALEELGVPASRPVESPSLHETPPHGSALGLSNDTPPEGRPAVELVEELPFEHLGHYRILARIGRGGMGDVYRGYDESLEREVAIKVLPAELARQADFIHRFRAEAMAAAKIGHPNVVPIFFIGEDAGHHFFVMQYIRGQTLSSRLASCGRLEVQEAVAVVEQCLRGLDAAHALGLIHRDVKPGNILLDQSTGRAMLVDFGLVRRIDDNARMTATGMVMGTVDYISPEQARGHAVDGRADLYSVGVLFYQVLSGRLPFVGEAPTAMLFQHAYEKPLPLEQVAPGLPEPLMTIVARLMAKDPAQRYQTASEVLADLQSFRDRRPLASLAPENRGGQALDVGTGDLDWNDELPLGLTDVPRYGPWQRARDWVATTLRRQSPQVFESLQSTIQQVDGAVATYERRRNRLARLVGEGQQLLDDLPEGPQRDQQREQLESLKLQLTQADATLARLRSQRDVLRARLRAAGAGLRAAGAGLHAAGAGLHAAGAGLHAAGAGLHAAGAGQGLATAGLPRRHRYWRVLGAVPLAGAAVWFTLFLLGYRQDNSIGSSSASLRLSDEARQTRSPITTIAAHQGECRFVLFSRNGRFLLSGGYDRTIRVWEYRSGQLVYTLAGRPSGFACGALSPDGKMLAVGDWSGEICLWDVALLLSRPAGGTASGMPRPTTPVAVLHGHTAQVNALEFTPDGKLLISGSQDKTLRSWDVEQRGEPQTLSSQSQNVTGIAIAPDGRMFATATGFWREPNKRGQVRLWELPLRHERGDLLCDDTLFRVVCFDPTGKTLAVGRTGQVVQLWDLKARRERASLQSDQEAFSLAFSPDGSRLAVGDFRGSVRLWNAGTGDLLAVVEAHRDIIYSLAFSPDGHHLATACKDGQVKIWAVGE